MTEFLDGGNAPEVFASGLARVEVLGTVCRFVLYAEHQTEDGKSHREIVINVIMPNAAIPPAIALTLKALPTGSIVPAVGTLVRSMVGLH